MRVLVLALCLALAVAAVATEVDADKSKMATSKAAGANPLAKVASRWGIPSFEDEGKFPSSNHVLCPFILTQTSPN